MAIPKELTTRTRTSYYLALFVFTITPIIAFFVGMNYQSMVDQINQQSIPVVTKQMTQISPAVGNNACLHYGVVNKDQFLISYSVKQGDSLLSIATQQLGDPSRVGEIIALNKDRYPSLSVSTPFLEQNWVLFLPPKSLTIKNSDINNLNSISEVNASIHSIDTNTGFWYLQTSTDGSAGYPVVKPDSKLPFRVGDCVSIISIGTEVLSVTAQ